MSKPTPAQVFQRMSVMDVLSELASRSLPLDGHNGPIASVCLTPSSPTWPSCRQLPRRTRSRTPRLPAPSPAPSPASSPSARARPSPAPSSFFIPGPFHTRFIPRFIPQALVPTPWPSQLPARANDYVSASCHSYGRERVGEPALHCGRAWKSFAVEGRRQSSPPSWTCC